MVSKSKRILFISSRPMTHFGNFGGDVVKGFEALGYEVDFLTRYSSFDSHEIGVLHKEYIKSRILGDILIKIKKYISKNFFLKEICGALCKRRSDNYIRGNNGRTIVSPDEKAPVVDNNLLLSMITRDYQFVYVYCWQDMITSSSLRAVYDKLRVPIIIAAYDFQPFTGGCYYFGDCRNYEKGCGTCPILESKDENDITRKNFMFKKETYDYIKCGVHANPYSMKFIEKTNLFPEERRMITYHPMDENKFRPIDKFACRKELGILQKYEYVIFARFAGAQHIVKGYPYMVEAVNLFADKLGTKKEQVLLLLAGSHDENFESKFDIAVQNLGLLNIDMLIKAYSAADIFLSTSIDDAGPSMVNQSIMCGTPVISFNIGSALYMVDNGCTGYRVEIRDSEAMSSNLFTHFIMSEPDRNRMRIKCREKGLEKGKLTVFCNSIIELSERI